MKPSIRHPPLRALLLGALLALAAAAPAYGQTSGPPVRSQAQSVGSGIGVYGAGSGIGVYGAGSGVGVYGAGSGIGVYGAGSGIGVYGAGSGIGRPGEEGNLLLISPSTTEQTNLTSTLDRQWEQMERTLEWGSLD